MKKVITKSFSAVLTVAVLCSCLLFTTASAGADYSSISDLVIPSSLVESEPYNVSGIVSSYSPIYSVEFKVSSKWLLSADMGDRQR